MTTNWEDVPVFISSTFNDMHAERDLLVKRVFPALAEWCEARRLRLVDIDLRWGVTEADSKENKRVVQVCLDNIDTCRPFFLCFIGQRRGWVPKPEDVSAQTCDDFPKLMSEKYLGNTSVTEMEILHAAINPMNNRTAVEHALFFLREPSYLAEMTTSAASDVREQLLRIYTNSGDKNPAAADAALDEWREKRIPALNRFVASYAARWDVNETTPEIADPCANTSYNEMLTTGRLRDFTVDGTPLEDIVLRELKKAILKRYPSRVDDATPEESTIAQDLVQQRVFAMRSREGFILREGCYDELDEYVASDAHVPFVLTSPAGFGKTMLLASYTALLEKRESLRTVARFVGGSDLSSNAYSLWRSVFEELDIESPRDYIDLFRAIPSLLAKATRGNSLVVIVDALDGLDEGLADTGWIPKELPAGVKLILSYRDDGENTVPLTNSLRAEGKVLFGRIEPFSVDDRRKLVDAYLRQFMKSLDEEHITALVKQEGAENPLFLKVILTELRVFGAYSQVGDRIRKAFGQSPLDAFDAVLMRLETDPAYGVLSPDEAVPLLFGLLAHARRGLSEDEICHCFSMAFPSESERFLRDTIRLVLRQVRSFLARYENRVDFLYMSFREAARKRYARLADEHEQLLADAFLAVCDPERDESFESDDDRALTEYGWHCVQLNPASKLFENLAYLHARTDASFDTDILLVDMERSQAATLWRDYILRFREVLSTTQNALFSIALHDNFEEAAMSAQAMLQDGRWRRPYFLLRPTHESQNDENAATAGGLSLNILRSSMLENSVASCAVMERHLMYFTDGLGRLRVLNTDSMRKDPAVLSVSEKRALGLFSSGDGELLIAAFDDGTAELLRVHFGADDTVLYSEVLACVSYLLPLYDDGVFAFVGNRLLFQQEEDAIVFAEISEDDDFISGGLFPSGKIPLRKSGELAAVLPQGRFGDFVVFIRTDGGIDVELYSSEKPEKGSLRSLFLPDCEIVDVAPMRDGGFVIAFAHGVVRTYSVDMELFGELTSCPCTNICETKDGIVCISTVARTVVLWDGKDADSAVTVSFNSEFERARVSTLTSFPDGSVIFAADRGAVVFRLSESNAVENIGINSERKAKVGDVNELLRGLSFPIEYGSILAVCADGEILCVLFYTPNIGSRKETPPTLGIGTYDDFASGIETRVAIPVSKDKPSMVLRGDVLFVCAGSILFAFNRNTLKPLAGMTTRSGLTRIYESLPENPAVLVQDGASRLYYCTLNPSGGN